MVRLLLTFRSWVFIEKSINLLVPFAKKITVGSRLFFLKSIVNGESHLKVYLTFRTLILENIPFGFTGTMWSALALNYQLK